MEAYCYVTDLYKPAFVSQGLIEVNSLWENMIMKDIDKNIIPKPSKERFMELITPIFKTKMIDAIRIKRNELLAKTDWTQIVDVTITNKEAYKEYRQLLRDLPDNINIEFGKELDEYLPKQP